MCFTTSMAPLTIKPDMYTFPHTIQPIISPALKKVQQCWLSNANTLCYHLWGLISPTSLQVTLGHKNSTKTCLSVWVFSIQLFNSYMHCVHYIYHRDHSKLLPICHVPSHFIAVAALLVDDWKWNMWGYRLKHSSEISEDSGNDDTEPTADSDIQLPLSKLVPLSYAENRLHASQWSMPLFYLTSIVPQIHLCSLSYWQP